MTVIKGATLALVVWAALCSWASAQALRPRVGETLEQFEERKRSATSNPGVPTVSSYTPAPTPPSVWPIFLDGSEKELRGESRETFVTVLSDKLKDFSSAQFRNVSVPRIDPWGKPVICGDINARNSYGAYIGFRAFIVIFDGTGKQFHLLTGGDAVANARAAGCWS